MKITEERFNEIYNSVVANAFYNNVGNVGEDGSISHEEMIDIMELAKRGMKKEMRKREVLDSFPKLTLE